MAKKMTAEEMQQVRDKLDKCTNAVATAARDNSDNDIEIAIASLFMTLGSIVKAGLATVADMAQYFELTFGVKIVGLGVTGVSIDDALAKMGFDIDPSGNQTKH